MKNKIFLFLIMLFLIQTSCAKIGSPAGGVKDTIPPVMIIAKPQNKSISFNSKKAIIYFDEYIKFDKLSSQLIISPPLEKKPTIKPEFSVSKKIEIEFMSTLKKNTTYTINFGNSIVDNNEGNELGKFSYVFSTGTYLDSLTISGEVSDPLTNNEIENISILAYKNANDTLIGNYMPDYVSNTLKGNSYSLNNLSEANYKVIALEDKNNNYKYDKGLEKIGFLNNEINLKPTDSLNGEKFDFVLFKEPKENKINRPIQTSGHLFILGYQGKETPKVTIEGLNENEYIISKPSEKDSLYFWYTETPKDSITFNIRQDNVVNIYTKKTRELKLDSLIINSNIKGVIHPNDSLILHSNIPIKHINKDSILVLEHDSIPIEYDIISNIKKQNIYVNFKRKMNRPYTITLKGNSFTDIFNRKSAKQDLKLKTIDSEEYGEIIFSIENTNNINLIIEISTDNFLTKYTKTSNKSKKISFKKLPKGNYKTRIISDLNSNNLHDGGNLELRIQPEPIFNLNTEITLRSNSEINEKVKI